MRPAPDGSRAPSRRAILPAPRCSGNESTGEIMSKALKVFAFAAALLSAPVWAHHGFGRFDPTKDVTIEGTLTGIDFVNPHAYLYFDAKTADGKVQPMRCEMRAATVLRRSGWSPEMFVPG